jgi:hypothetical protein
MYQIGDTLVKLTFYVYGLIESDTGALRYVGKTFSPESRFRQHLNSDGSRASAVRTWISSVLERGAEIHMRILAVCDYEDESLSIEHKLITSLPNLINSAIVMIPRVPERPSKAAWRAPPELPAGATMSERVAHARLLAQWPEPPNTGNP